MKKTTWEVPWGQYDPILKNALKVQKNKSITYLLVYNVEIVPKSKWQCTKETKKHWKFTYTWK